MVEHSFDVTRDKVRQPRKKGRYDSTEAIIKKIDEAQAEGTDLLKQAEALDVKADEAKRTGNSTAYVTGWRLEAARLRERATRKFEVRCKFLKDKLAVFQTDTFPGIGIDKSIPKVGGDKYAERAK